MYRADDAYRGVGGCDLIHRHPPEEAVGPVGEAFPRSLHVLVDIRSIATGTGDVLLEELTTFKDSGREVS